MLIQIILIFLAIIILFALFLPNGIEFNFANGFWEIRFENLFFKYNFGSKDVKKDKILSADEPIEKKKKKKLSKKEEEKENKKFEQKEEEKERVSPKISAETVQKEENRIPEINEIPETDEIPEFDGIEDKNEKSILEWLEFAKEIWEREKKTVKSLLKFVIKIVNLSLKLLIPAKIEVNICVGVNEPAYTGWLYSLFILLNSFFEKNRRISLNFTPDFVKTVFKFDGCVRYCFSIASIFLFLLVIMVYVPYLQILKCIWRNRKKFLKRG